MYDYIAVKHCRLGQSFGAHCYRGGAAVASSRPPQLVVEHAVGGLTVKHCSAPGAAPAECYSMPPDKTAHSAGGVDSAAASNAPPSLTTVLAFADCIFTSVNHSQRAPDPSRTPGPEFSQLGRTAGWESCSSH